MHGPNQPKHANRNAIHPLSFDAFCPKDRFLMGHKDIGAKRQFFLLSVLFAVVLAGYSGWIVYDQLKIIKIVTDLQKDTVPLMVQQLRTARDLDSLRFEANNVIYSETPERSNQGLYYVSVHAGALDFQQDAVAGALVEEVTELLKDFNYADRHDYMDKWADLSDRMKYSSDQMSFEAIALGNESISSVEDDLTESLQSNIWMLLLGIALQLLTLLYVGIAFIEPLKKLGKHLSGLDAGDAPQSIDLNSHTTEIKSIENAVNRLAVALRTNRLMNRDLLQSEVLLKREMALAKEATRIKSEFISNISHEIRTPLSTIAGMLYLLEKSNLTPGQLRRVDLLKQCSSHLNDLITQVLDLSKMEAHMLALENRVFRLNDLLEECKAIFSVEAADKQLGYEFDVPPRLQHLVLRGDPLRVKEIVFNLLSNAIKFTSEGSVSLRAQWLEQSPDQKVKLRISVTDTGIGLTSAEMTQLFQNFSQADSSTSRRFGGTGLGLSISQKLAELMSGEIGVSSVPGHGSEFWCTLWLQLGDVAEADSRAPAAADMPTDRRPPTTEALPTLPTDSDSPTRLCGRLASLVSVDDPAALSLFETHADAMAGVLGEVFAPFKRALLAYRMPEAADLLTKAGCKPSPPTAASPANRPWVLLVDDTPANLTFLVGLLSDLCHLRVATSGQRAVDMAGSNPPPQLVLMDVAMPDVDGFGALQAMKTNPATRDVPVMLISASSNAQISEKSVELGAVGLIDRITPPQVLRNKVAEVLHLHA